MAPQSGSTSNAYGYRRFGFTLLLVGQIWLHLLQGRVYWRKIPEHLFKTGPAAMFPVLIVNFLAGMIFTIQTARQLDKYGAINEVGGAFAIAFCRELAPLLTSSVVAGLVGSAFTAEIASMKVSEQIDALYTLRTDPIDYLVLPRVLASSSMTPILIILGLVCGIFGGALAAFYLYKIAPDQFFDSVRKLLEPSDLMMLWLKGLIFGGGVGAVSCGWGMTTKGGVKQVGESATAAIVISGVVILVADLLLSIFIGLPTSNN